MSRRSSITVSFEEQLSEMTASLGNFSTDQKILANNLM